MSTDHDFVEYVRSQSGLGSELSDKRMFGEYALYLGGKVVAFACDNQLYVKPTDTGRAFLGKVSEHPPFPGAKVYFRIDEELDDRDRLAGLLRTTAQALPMPKAKTPFKARTAAKAGPAARSTSAAKPNPRPATKAAPKKPSR